MREVSDGRQQECARCRRLAVAERAYAHFLARGARHGDDWADWFRAEAGLGQESGNGTQPAAMVATPLKKNGQKSRTPGNGRSSGGV